MPALSHAAVLERVRAALRGSAPASVHELADRLLMHPLLVATALGVLVDRGQVVRFCEARALFVEVRSPSQATDPKEVSCALPL